MSEDVVIKDVLAAWVTFKEMEADAKEQRQRCEDVLAKFMQLNSADEGSRMHEIEGYKVNVNQRMSRKIDADLLQELAAQNGISAHLRTLFRWKPEINIKEWTETDEKITSLLLDAITTKPGRPSFKITPAKKDD